MNAPALKTERHRAEQKEILKALVEEKQKLDLPILNVQKGNAS
jgi:hypothetical protein